MSVVVLMELMCLLIIYKHGPLVVFCFYNKNYSRWSTIKSRLGEPSPARRMCHKAWAGTLGGA